MGADSAMMGPARSGARPPTYDLVVVGGGIVGCATALRFLESHPGTRIALVEKEPDLARHQSGRNSGVIHSGLYYHPGSLKARYCREGYRRLLDFCRAEGVAHEICGKLVVATSEDELPRLEELERRGRANGLAGLRYLGPDEIREVEPHCWGIAGLLVPETGIVDFAAVTRAYARRAAELGAEVVLGERVEDIRPFGGGVEVIGRGSSWSTRAVVVCAGLQADRLARLTEPDLPVAILPFRGEYYRLKPAARHLVRNLVYPVPDPRLPFLGVHFTRTIDGSVECGPNAVFAFGREAYHKTDFDLRDTWMALTWPGTRHMAKRYWRTAMDEYHRSLSRTAFTRDLQKLLPEITENDLDAGGAGIRAQACDREGNLLDDFSIHTNGRVVQVLNAPSPAATSSLAIGDALAGRASGILG